MSIVTAVGSFGYFISPLYTSYSLIKNGWVETLFVFMIFLFIGLIVAFFVRSPSTTQFIEKPNDQSILDALKEAFKNKSYILLTSGFFVCGFHITLVGTHVPKYVIDRGLESWTAATILSLIALLSGYLSTKMSKKFILSSIYALRGVSIILFIFLPASNINAFIFGASFGFLWLSTVPATSGIVAHMFGTKYLGVLYGIVFLSHQVGSFFGAFLGGLFHDLYGSYDYAWYLAIALSVFAAIIHLPIKEQAVLRLKTE
jgi:MFS family permease